MIFLSGSSPILSLLERSSVTAPSYQTHCSKTPLITATASDLLCRVTKVTSCPGLPSSRIPMLPSSLYRYPGKASLICHLGKSMKCLGAITSIKVNFKVKEETKRKKIRKEGRRGKPELEIPGDHEGLCAGRVRKPWCRLSRRPMVWL